MGAFKNEKNGTWYVQFRYTDWQGLRQQKLKRGFATKREAQEWERAFLTEKKADVTMPFKTFTELYEKDVRPKLKENTWLTKEHIIKTKILPYFEHKRLCDISAKDVIAWQNEIRKMTNSSGEPLSQGYLKTMLPDLLPAEEEKEANVDIWAMRHKRYLKQNHKVRYYNLLTSGKLNSYLADIEQQA